LISKRFTPLARSPSSQSLAHCSIPQNMELYLYIFIV
jgi:hypothetical protein